MSEQGILRFAVRHGAHHRAAVWTLWTGHGHEVYVGCHVPAGHLTASLHEPGPWRLSFADDAPANPGADADERPVVGSSVPSATLRTVARIITPPAAVATPIEDAEARVRWIPRAPEGHATAVELVLTSRALKVVDWPGARTLRTSLVGSLMASSGDTLWAVHRVVPFTRPPMSPMSGMHNLAFDVDADGTRVIYEVARRPPAA